MRLSTLVLLVMLFIAGCKTGSQLDMAILESPQGAVYLERIPTRQFQAAHPVRLDSQLIARVLQGVTVREDNGLLQSIGMGQKPIVAAFSQADIAFLAPAIAKGLSQAAADQQIGFRLSRTEDTLYRERAGAGVGSSDPPAYRVSESTTAGRLFVYGRSLYLTLHQFRHRPEPADSIDMPNRRLPDPTGLRNHTVRFVPESVLRPDIYTPAFATEEGFTTLVIDYDVLAKLPASAVTLPLQTLPPPAAAQPRPAPASAPNEASPSKDDLRQIREEMKQKETEVEDLRKELEEIKRQLSNRPTDRGGPASPPRTKPGTRTP
ncbi:MAG: hypothetical protein OJF47_001631 [Nitrospira sp.]|jgi:hypothetical protein|nr:MAG: hypothetical protein OJF47_001631 [Nitrospira sp.]